MDSLKFITPRGRLRKLLNYRVNLLINGTAKMKVRFYIRCFCRESIF